MCAAITQPHFPTETPLALPLRVSGARARPPGGPAEASRALGLRLRPEPDDAGLAARRRRGCGDIRLGPSEGRLGRGPPPRGIGGPRPRPAPKARGRRLARPDGRGSPGPVLGVGPSGPSAPRSPPAPPRRGRSCRRSERRSLPAEAGPAYAVGRALFPNSEREAAPPPTRVRPERRREVLGAGGGWVPRSAGAGRAGGGKGVQTPPAGFAAVRAGAAETSVGGRRVVGRTVPPAGATTRPSPGLARVQASGHRFVPGNSCGAISIVALGGTPKQRGSLLGPALGGGRRLLLGTPPRMCSFSSPVLMPRLPSETVFMPCCRVVL